MDPKKLTAALATILMFTVALGNAQKLPKGFEQLLKDYSMEFAIPPGFEATRVIDNGDVAYDYAVKSKTKKLEIRYRIWPMGDNPLMYEAMLMTMALNISDDQLIKTAHFPAADVKAEFGADDGATGTIPVHSEFGKGYKLCSISVIHKNDGADAFIFILCDDLNTLLGAISSYETFHALKFKP